MPNLFEPSISSRKSEHLSICQSEQAYFAASGTSLDQVELLYDALPELNLKEIQLNQAFMNYEAALPVMIGAMTGGCEEAVPLNQILAEFAQEMKLPMALGSCRAYLNKGAAGFPASYELKKKFPKLFLIGNVGAVSLNYDLGWDQIQKLKDNLNLDALYFHLNPLQEIIQKEGDTNFAHLLGRLAEMIEKCREIGLPVGVKEVGAGLGKNTLGKLKTLPLQFLELAGTGGTSWAYVEALRTDNQLQKHLGTLWRHFGVSTLQTLLNANEIWPRNKEPLGRRQEQKPVMIASGGLRHGIDVVKCLALGADFTAMAHPFLQAASQTLKTSKHLEQSPLHDFYHTLSAEMRMSLFLTASSNIQALQLHQPIRMKYEPYTSLR